MSKYIFITADVEIPEIDLTNEQIITPKEANLKGIKPPNWCTWDDLDPSSDILYIENEDDLGNLCIRKNFDFIEEINFYTNKKFTYIISCTCDKKRAKQLLKYLQDINITSQIEIYSILIDSNIEINTSKVNLDELNEDLLLNIICLLYTSPSPRDS